MNLILRLGGDEIDVESLSKLTTLVPYRIEHRGVDRSRINCLFYDINDTERLGDGFLGLRQFLRQNRSFLDAVQKIDGITIRDIDIGLMVPSDIFAKNLILDAELLKSLGELGLSVAVAVYKTSETEGETLT